MNEQSGFISVQTPEGFDVEDIEPEESVEASLVEIWAEDVSAIQVADAIHEFAGEDYGGLDLRIEADRKAFAMDIIDMIVSAIQDKSKGL